MSERGSDEFAGALSGPAMSMDANAELFRLLIEAAHEAPVETVANIMETMATVLNRRLQDAADACE